MSRKEARCSSLPHPLALLRSRSYIVLLVVAAIIGAPVSALAYFFLALVSKMQGWIFTDLPKGVGFHAEPLWWPLLPLLLAGRTGWPDHPVSPPGRAATHPPTDSRPARSCRPPAIWRAFCWRRSRR